MYLDYEGKRVHIEARDGESAVYLDIDLDDTAVDAIDSILLAIEEGTYGFGLYVWGDPADFRPTAFIPLDRWLSIVRNHDAAAVAEDKDDSAAMLVALRQEINDVLTSYETDKGD